MRAASLDRRVRKEARLLVREARAALAVKRGLRGKAGDLEGATASVEKGLAGNDLAGVRRGLPTLDALVDELVKRPPKSTTRDYVESIGAAILIALALRAFVVEAFKIPSSSMYPTLEIGDHIFVNKFLYGVRIPWTNTKLLELRAPKRGEVIVFMQPCRPDRDYIKRVVALAGDTVEVRCDVLYVNGAKVPAALAERADTCQYNDVTELGSGFTARCSRYTETVEGLVYNTYHPEGRPTLEAQRTSESEPPGSSDFPSEVLRTCTNAVSPDDRVPAANQLPGALVETKADAGSCEVQRHYVVPAGHVFAMGDNRSNSNDSRFWGSVPVENIKGKSLFIWLSYEHWGLFDWGGIRWDRIGTFVH